MSTSMRGSVLGKRKPIDHSSAKEKAILVDKEEAILGEKKDETVGEKEKEEAMLVDTTKEEPILGEKKDSIVGENETVGVGEEEEEEDPGKKKDSALVEKEKESVGEEEDDKEEPILGEKKDSTFGENKTVGVGEEEEEDPGTKKDATLGEKEKEGVGEEEDDDDEEDYEGLKIFMKELTGPILQEMKESGRRFELIQGRKCPICLSPDHYNCPWDVGSYSDSDSLPEVSPSFRCLCKRCGCTDFSKKDPGDVLTCDACGCGIICAVRKRCHVCMCFGHVSEEDPKCRYYGKDWTAEGDPLLQHFRGKTSK